MNAKTVLIMAGGTGGHVFPGLAVAKEFLGQGVAVHWLGTRRGIESRLVPAKQIELHTMPVVGIRGRGLLALILAPLNIARAVFAAMKIIRVVKPKIIIGFGGYVAGPGGLAAKILGIPLVIHEQNAIPGTTNKWLARLAKKVFLAFPNSLAGGEWVGNPVREEIENIAPPEVRMSKNTKLINLLVIGGSRGAQAINEIVPAALKDVKSSLSVWHQTGEGKKTETLSAYKGVTHEYRVDEFIDEIAEAYAWADLAICRSGALTISELSAAGLASILVPFPYAIDDHQTKNAEHLSRSGAALIRQQQELNALSLSCLLTELGDDKGRLIEMAKHAREQAKPRAAKVLVSYCMELLDEAA